MRIIDADALQTALVDEYNEIAGYRARLRFYRAIEIAKEQPTIEPKRGAWICEPQGVPAGNGEFEIEDYYRCSACDYGLTSDATQYCPNCGADMRTEDHP